MNISKKFRFIYFGYLTPMIYLFKIIRLDLSVTNTHLYGAIHLTAATKTSKIASFLFLKISPTNPYSSLFGSSAISFCILWQKQDITKFAIADLQSQNLVLVFFLVAVVSSKAP